MTDITDQDRRLALRWCDMLGDSTLHKEAAATRRVILATVDAPAPTLAERLMEQFYYHEHTDEQGGIILDAQQMERDLEEALAEVERLTAERDAARDNEAGDSMRQQAEAWSKVWNHPVMRAAEPGEGSALSRALGVLDSLHAVQKGAESNAETPDPADVPAGEAWLVEVDGERRPDVKDKEDPIPWNTVSTNGVLHPEYNGNVTLLHRLVPAPRVITNPDELDRLAEGAIVRDKDGDAWRRTCDEWTTTADYGRFTSWAVSRSGPVTVLWEPEA